LTNLKTSKTKWQVCISLSFSMKYFGSIWVDWMIFVLNVLIIILRNGKSVKWSLRVLMMNIGAILRLCTPGVWVICSLRLPMKFEISLSIWLMIHWRMTMLKRLLVTLTRPLHDKCYIFRWESVWGYIL